MVLDSSAILSILFDEEGHERFVDILDGAKLIVVGAPTLLEATMVATRAFGLGGRALVAQFVDRWAVVVMPMDARHAQVAIDAFLRFGKGRHPAALNYGDCMTYATASVAGLPLLFSGNDFGKTDLAVA